MVRDAVTALIALVLSLPPLVALHEFLDGALLLVGLHPYHWPPLHALHAACAFAIWAAVALVFARLTGSLPVALFRTALAAFPVTLLAAFAVTSRQPLVLWIAAVTPLAVAMLAHAMRLALLGRDGDGRFLVTRDDRGRAAACHAMAAIGALYVVATLSSVTGRLSDLRWHGYLTTAELWVWFSIIVVGLLARAVFVVLARAPGVDPTGKDVDPLECCGAGLTLGLLGLAGIGWGLVTIGMAHRLGPAILSGLLHLAVAFLAVLALVQLRTLLERWRTRYGGASQLDAFGCALLVLAGPLLLALAVLATLGAWHVVTIWLVITGLLALAVGTALSAYYLPAGEREPLARVVAIALTAPLLAAILAR